MIGFLFITGGRGPEEYHVLCAQRLSSSIPKPIIKANTNQCLSAVGKWGQSSPGPCY